MSTWVTQRVFCFLQSIFTQNRIWLCGIRTHELKLAQIKNLSGVECVIKVCVTVFKGCFYLSLGLIFGDCIGQFPHSSVVVYWRAGNWNWESSAVTKCWTRSITIKSDTRKIKPNKWKIWNIINKQFKRLCYHSIVVHNLVPNSSYNHRQVWP